MDAERNPYLAPASGPPAPQAAVAARLRQAVGCYVAAYVLELLTWVALALEAPADRRLAYAISTACLLLGMGLLVAWIARLLLQGSWRARRWVLAWTVVEAGLLAYTLWPPLAPDAKLALELARVLVRIAAGVLLVLPGMGGRFRLPADPRS